MRKIKKYSKKNIKKKYKRIPKYKYLKNDDIEIISLDNKEAKQILDSKAYSEYLKQSKNNIKPIRVLYKKPNQPPVVKIISNIKLLKRTIIEKNLQIIPYENLYIICNSKKQMEKMNINIVFEFSNIAGDFILINIDKRKREFKGLNKEDIEWYTADLINKSFAGIQ